MVLIAFANCRQVYRNNKTVVVVVVVVVVVAVVNVKRP